MALPYVFQQAATPANSKRKAPVGPVNTPPRKIMPAWNKKLDGLGHCYEGELTEDQRKPLLKGGAENLLAKEENEAAKQGRQMNQLRSTVGTSRDAVMAKMRLLHEAHQRLAGSSGDQAARYGKEKLSLGDMLPLFQDLNKLWEGKTEQSAADLDKSSAVLLERDQLREERDHCIEKVKAARQERDSYRQERDRYRQERDHSRQERDLFLKQRSSVEQERDTLLQERDHYRQERDRYRQERDHCRQEQDLLLKRGNSVKQERDTLLQERDHFFQQSEMLKQKRDKLHHEKEQYHQQLLEEKAAKQSLEIGTVPRSVLIEAQEERDEYCERSTRYRQERNNARLEHDSIHGQMVQYQTQVLQLQADLKDERMQLNISKDTNTKLEKDVNALRGALKEERQEFKSRSDELRSELRSLESKYDFELHKQMRSLQGFQDSKVDGAKLLHELNVRQLTEAWDYEKAELLASTVSGRDKIKDLESAAEKTKQSHTTTLRTIQLNSSKLSRQTAGRNQETINGLVVAIAVLRSSYNYLLSALAGRDGIINIHIVHSQAIEKRLTQYKEANATLQVKSNRLQKELHDKEEELGGLSTANKTNMLTLSKLRDAHAGCEHNERLQLGRTDRKDFFEHFSTFTRSLSERGTIFRGQESSHDVDVCFCVLPERDEGLCVIRRLGGAFTIWHSETGDCSTFSHAWHKWLCLGGENQGKPIYISLISSGEAQEWLQMHLTVRTVSAGEIDTFQRQGYF